MKQRRSILSFILILALVVNVFQFPLFGNGNVAYAVEGSDTKVLMKSLTENEEWVEESESYNRFKWDLPDGCLHANFRFQVEGEPYNPAVHGGTLEWYLNYWAEDNPVSNDEASVAVKDDGTAVVTIKKAGPLDIDVCAKYTVDGNSTEYRFNLYGDIIDGYVQMKKPDGSTEGWTGIEENSWTASFFAGDFPAEGLTYNFRLNKDGGNASPAATSWHLEDGNDNPLGDDVATITKNADGTAVLKVKKAPDSQQILVYAHYDENLTNPDNEPSRYSFYVHTDIYHQQLLMENPEKPDAWISAKENSNYTYSAPITEVPADGKTFNFRFEVYNNATVEGVTWRLEDTWNEGIPSEDVAELVTGENGTAKLIVKQKLGEFALRVIAQYGEEDYSFGVEGSISQPDTNIEVWSEKEAQWIDSDQRWFLDAKEMPETGKQYDFRLAFGEKSYQDFKRGTIQWELLNGEDMPVDAEYASLKVDEEDPGRVSVTIMPVMGERWVNLRATYTLDGEESLEPIVEDKYLDYGVYASDDIGYYNIQTWDEGETECSLVGVKPGWDGKIPAAISYDGQELPMDRVSSFRTIFNEFGDSERTSVSTITIPKSVGGIYGNRFNDVKNLEAIVADGDSNYYYTKDGVLYDRDVETLIQYPTKKAGKRYEIPEGVRWIDDYAFGGFGKYQLKTLIVPDSLDFRENMNSLFEKFIQRDGSEFSAWNIKVWAKNNETLSEHAQRYVDMDSETPALPWATYKSIEETKSSLPNADVQVSPTSYVYDGEAKTPAVSVKGLTAGVDYTVSYSNNVSAGKGTVTVNGKGDYTGTIIKNFTISKANMKTGVSAKGYENVYDGKAHSITVTAPEGATVKYATSENGTYSTSKPSRTSAGTTTVYYRVSNPNYNEVTGSVKITIKKKALTSATLGTTTYTYNGSAKKPPVTVKSGAVTILSKKTAGNKDVSVSYASGRKNVGTYKVTIKGIGNYSGSFTKTFKINPAKPAMKTPVGAKKAITVKWSKVSKQATGYEILLATNSKFTQGKKTVKVTSNTITSKKIGNLKAKKKYFVKVRTYKTVSGKKYYSAWAKAKSVKTK